MKSPSRVSLLALVLFVSACSTTRTLPPSAAPAPTAEAETKSALDLAVLNATRASERYTVGGLPLSGMPVIALENTGYAVGFSEEHSQPLWAAYYCAPNETFKNGPRPSGFKSDARVPAASRLKDSDYDRPPGTPTYDRGHMAPNYAIATRYGRQAQLETFLLTNVVPQRSSLNQQTWRALEAEIAHNFAPSCKGVWVLVGPIFEGPLTRYNGKARMPSAFYCIVLDRTDDGVLRALALTMDQSVSGKRRMGDFITSVRDIERRTGIDFFSGLPDAIEEALEKAKADSAWNWELMLVPNKYND